MQNSLPKGKGAMAALVGLEINEVKKLISELSNNLVCEIANYNLINQSNYMRIVPNIIVKIVGPDEKVIMQEIIVLNNEYFKMNEQKPFSTNFINYPKNANKVLIEIIP